MDSRHFRHHDDSGAYLVPTAVTTLVGSGASTRSSRPSGLEVVGVGPVLSKLSVQGHVHWSNFRAQCKGAVELKGGEEMSVLHLACATRMLDFRAAAMPWPTKQWSLCFLCPGN
jgi:hypothetical protein